MEIEPSEVTTLSFFTNQNVAFVRGRKMRFPFRGGASILKGRGWFFKIRSGVRPRNGSSAGAFRVLSRRKYDRRCLACEQAPSEHEKTNSANEAGSLLLADFFPSSPGAYSQANIRKSGPKGADFTAGSLSFFLEADKRFSVNTN